ncbi:SO_0444 family Cu/Zn efflux transporter [Phycisphaera mikurensis]|uniref:Hypothetical membrane protein n=1 Tax=Phycisphaera mikurensis (strain NBRC 102666 / KCTC 22515 / FYK2301M01) TaxID=1142394 RepID=I0IJ16_PHYMF|nr:SO_0444 family Cu/Zn efflux transporter [Phycisphaera mikurensis]MBB6443101.1 hypothetical protein [Phycisphaera mikurensis]BAM05254.1 hypothetical membrane protein [Phycisphaera mikurensis NBRC 102666]
MVWIQLFLSNLGHVVLEAAPWLLLGLAVSGLIKVYLPAGLLQRWLGGGGVGPVFTAAVIGTPLPLCSCSVVPAALTLRRGGAGKGATVSFLVSTPENGADSIALSWALLGPFMTVARPVAAVSSAVLAGLLAGATDQREGPPLPAPAAAAAAAASGSSPPASAAASCCASGGGVAAEPAAPARPKPLEALRYAADELFGDIALWLTLGILLAALVQTLVPPGTIAGWGGGLPAMLGVMLLGVPMYLCATASTPVAAALLLAGVSPGTALVFLLAGPATNLGTIGIVRQELGGRACAAYLAGACGGALACGLLADALVSAWSIPVAAQAAAGHDMLPLWLSAGSAIVLGALLLRWALRGWMPSEAKPCRP